MPSAVTVLITGSAGRIGRAAVRELTSRGHVVRGFDRMPTPGLDDTRIGDIADGKCIQDAMEGIQTLIHLAATPDDADFLTELLPNNVIGAYHVLEAARQAGVRRLILASSGQVVWGQRLNGPWPITTDVVPRPRYWYAATKVFLEAAGRAYADRHGLEVIVVRLGWCPRDAAQAHELAATPWAHDVYLSPADAGRFFACAVEAQSPISYAIVYASSRPVRQDCYDLSIARNLLGYEPHDRWPEGIEDLLGRG
jgi:nucleoside-diphosphate-sugar epimerase